MTRPSNQPGVLLAALLATVSWGCDDAVGSADAGNDSSAPLGDVTGGSASDSAMDSAGVDVDATDVDIDLDWQTAHCLERDCFFVMQGAAGATDDECNGRHPVDRATVDEGGLGDCPFATLTGPVTRILSPPDGVPARATSVFVGGGTYNVAPFGLRIRGDGADASEAVRFSTWRGESVTIDGSCPESCVVQGPDGPVTLEPCCFRDCPTCDADPRCLPNLFSETECAVPIRHVEQLITVWGQWVRIEGFMLLGCFEDNIRVAFGQELDPPRIIPNRHLYIANNVIEGCDVNENIKGLRNGPGPIHGGPVWGPVHVIGNEFFAMASQAVDATGVHNWLVEESYLHDARAGENELIGFDGGGLGFKNGGSDVRVRNNWSVAGGSYGLGGVSGSCPRDDTPPSDWGCFQRWEMRDSLVENNVAIRPAAASPEGRNTRRGLEAYQCDDCRFFGNVITGVDGSAGFLISDDCPGPRCSDHNPILEPSRDLRFERNFIAAGTRNEDGGPVMLIYERDVHTDGPSGHGMSSRDNIFCAAAGFDEVADPETEAFQFAHREPGAVYTLADFREQIGDTGSRVYNHGDAAVAACPAGPPPCTVSVSATSASWAGPAGCEDCACTLVWDDAEEPADCAGTADLPVAAAEPGRHYLSLRVDRPGGGTSCGASYNLAAEMIGARCLLGVNGDEASWSTTGLSCRLLADGDLDLGEVACDGSQALPPALLTPGRHHLRLQVRDAPEGQTTCGVMFNR